MSKELLKMKHTVGRRRRQQSAAATIKSRPKNPAPKCLLLTMLLLLLFAVSSCRTGQQVVGGGDGQLKRSQHSHSNYFNSAQTQTMEVHKQRAAPAEATGFQEETGKTMFEERSAPAHPQPSKRSVWDFNAQPNQLAGKGGQLVNSFHQQALRFQVEPPALVEYSNSTGTVIPCRPATVASADGPSTAKLSMAGQRLSQPIAISWHQVKSLDLFQQALQGDPQEQESLEQLQRSEQVGPAKSGRRYVRQDGSLVLAPFKAGDLDKDQLAATYRCCLASRSGSICSRPVRTRAVVDAELNPEVFDEFALLGNSAVLRCQVSDYLVKHVDFVGWLKDDKSIATIHQQELLSKNLLPAPSSRQQGDQQQKYLLLKSGELYIRNVSKFDQANYKCKVRYKLHATSNTVATSKIGGQLMVDDSRTRTALRLMSNGNNLQQQQQSSIQTNSRLSSLVVVTHETTANNDHPEPAILCAHFQSQPVANFSWFKVVQSSSDSSIMANNQLLPINQESFPEIKQLDSCLIIRQVDSMKHPGEYLCEANNGQDPILKSSIRLIVNSAQLTAQLHLAVRGNQNEQQTTMTPASKPSIVAFNSMIQLNCSISGHPYDTVAWFKDAKLIAASSSVASDMPATYPNRTTKFGNNIKLIQANVIAIENFGLKDRGIYQCQVYSAAKSPHTSDQMMLVKQKPTSSMLLDSDHWRAASSSLQIDILFSKPNLYSKFQGQTINHDTPMSIQCSSSGLPLPKITWLLDGMPIVPTSGGLATKPLLNYQPSTVNEQEASNVLSYDDDYEYPAGQEDLLGGDQNNINTLSSDPLSLDFMASLAGYRAAQLTIKDERFHVSHYVTTNELNGQPMIVSQLNVSQMALTETGQYKCLAANPLGSVQHSAQINVIAQQQQPTTIQLRSYQPTNVTMIAGKSISLQCPLIGFPLAKIDWFKDDQRLPQNHRQRIEPIKQGSGGQLELTNVDAKLDSGNYNCRVSVESMASQEDNDKLSSASAAAMNDYDAGLVGQWRVNIKVAPLIDLQSLPEVIQANEGMRTKLVCSVVQGDHPIEMKWFKRIGHKQPESIAKSLLAIPGYELMQNKVDEATKEDLVTIHNLDDSCLLTFKQIAYTDSADYVCLAQNEVSSTLRSTRIIVNVAPSWSQEPVSEVSVLLGQRLHVDCATHGHPKPTVSWKRAVQDKTVASNNKETNSNHQQQQEFQDLISNYRQRAYLNGSLIIDQVDQNDGGSIMCEVNNGIGLGLSKVIRIHINVPPYFKHRASTYLSQIGSKAELKCLVNGDQPMIVGWRKENDIVIDLLNDSRHRIVNEHRISNQLFESQLTIENLTRSDSGYYICIASNEFGTEDMRVQLIVQEAPEAPIVMRPIRANSRQATISFRPPYSGNSVIKKYAINFRRFQEPMDFLLGGGLGQVNSSKESTTSWQQVIVDAPSSSPDSIGQSLQVNSEYSATSSSQLVNLNLCCLQPFTRYLVQVKAINEIGFSDLSKPIQFMTDEEAIGGPPQEVSVEPTGAHSLKVKFRAPARELQNGLIRGYYIGYRAISGSSSLANIPIPASSTASSLIQFHQQQSPNIKVFDTNDNGNNGANEQYQYKNVQLDFNNLNSPLLSSLRQQHLMTSPNSSQLDNFQQFQDSLLSNNNNLTGNQQSPQVFTTYLTNLRRKTTYSIIVQAYNKIGAGPRSDQIIVSTMDAAPPMSPILKVVSVTTNSVSLIWSSKRFHHNQHQESSTMAQNNGSQMLQFELDANFEEDDDPQAYYTINFKVDDARNLQTRIGSGQLGNLTSEQDFGQQQWQQRRVQKKSQQQLQQVPYVLNNLRCGSHHLVYITATNSLGQSEPGQTIRFTTMGGAPVGPSSSREFLALNSTYVLLKLGTWQNNGCIINSFTIKYKLSSQVKWTILEHQVYPTIQTITISGTAVFSTRPLSPGQEQHSQSSSSNNDIDDSFISGPQQLNNRAAGYSLMESAKRGRNQNYKQQVINDFIIRSLLPNSNYKLIVEANSEAGSTIAEYDLDTGNFSTSTVSITVHGITGNLNERTDSEEDSSMILSSRHSGSGDGLMDGLDFNYGGQQRSLGPFQRYNFNIWSLSVLFVIASIFMAITTLILGFRSIVRMKPLNNSRDSLLSTMFCCSSSSSSASAAGSSHSSSGGTCYQTTNDHQLDAYSTCTGPLNYQANNLGLIQADGETPIRRAPAATISGHVDARDAAGLGHLESLPYRQMILSSSLSTIGGPRPFNTLHRRHASTLDPDGHFRDSMTRLTGDDNSSAAKITNSRQHDQIRAHYAATLGKQQSTFLQNSQPIKFNTASPLYGRLQANHQQQAKLQQQQSQELYSSHPYNLFQQQLQHPTMSTSTGTTSGYETSTNSTNRLNNSSDSNADCHQQAIYLHHQNMSDGGNNFPLQNIYNSNNMVGCIAESNLFDNAQQVMQTPQQQVVFAEQEVANEGSQNQGQFHYNLPLPGCGPNNNDIELSKAAEQLTSTAYGMIFGTGQPNAAMNKTNQQDNQQPFDLNFDQQQLNHHLQMLANHHDN